MCLYTLVEIVFSENRTCPKKLSGYDSFLKGSHGSSISARRLKIDLLEIVFHNYHVKKGEFVLTISCCYLFLTSHLKQYYR